MPLKSPYQSTSGILVLLFILVIIGLQRIRVEVGRIRKRLQKSPRYQRLVALLLNILQPIACLVVDIVYLIWWLTFGRLQDSCTDSIRLPAILVQTPYIVYTFLRELHLNLYWAGNKRSSKQAILICVVIQ